MKRRSLFRGALGATVLGLTTALASQPALAEFQPRKPVEFIIMAGTGGGADQMARLIQSIIQQNDLSPVPFIPINKPGGSGAEALRYMQDKAGDDHTVMITLNSFFTTPQLNPGLGVDITKFTPIARMAVDTFQLWVTSDSGIESLEDYINAVKNAGKGWKMGGTGQGQEDTLVTGMLQDAFDIEVTYVPFPGGGTVAKNLIGKHIDSTVNNPAEQMGFYEAGDSRPLMTMTPERLDAFPDTPTSAELGYPDLVYYMQRNIFGPPEMSDDAQAYYIDLFRKVFDSKQWIDFTTSDGLFRDWLDGDDLGEFAKQAYDQHTKLLKAMGQL